MALLAPEFRRDEDLFSWNAAVFYGPSNAAFVAVYLRSVNVAVTHLEGIQTSLICLIAVCSLVPDQMLQKQSAGGGGIVHAETNGGDCMATVEGESVSSSGAGHGD